MDSYTNLGEFISVYEDLVHVILDLLSDVEIRALWLQNILGI